MKKFKLKNKSGFTLLEITISLSIFIVLIFAWFNFSISSYQSAAFGEDQIEAIRSAQKGIDIMAREIREASVAENGSYPLVLAGDQEIIFYSDIDQDVYTEKIRYTLNGTNLEKGVTEPTGDPLDYTGEEKVTIISTNVRNDISPIFTYYNGDYPDDTENNPLPAPTRLIETKLLHVFLKINIDPLRAPTDFDLETDVQLRNLKDNL